MGPLARYPLFTSSQRTCVGDRTHRVGARSSQRRSACLERRARGVNIVDQHGVGGPVAALRTSMRPGARRAARDEVPPGAYGAPVRARQDDTGSPRPRRDRREQRSAWSKPRARRRAGAAGTGTSAAGGASRPGGAPATICAAIASATGERAAELERVHERARRARRRRPGPTPPAPARRPPASSAAARQRAGRSAGTAARAGTRSCRAAATAQRLAGATWRAARPARGRGERGEQPAREAGEARRGRRRAGGRAPSRAAGARRVTAPPRDCDNPAQWLRTLRGRSTRVRLALIGLRRRRPTSARWRRARGAGPHPAEHRPAGASSPPAWWLILIALVSPLDSLGDQLMVMHMVQHILLLDIAPIRTSATRRR